MQTVVVSFAAEILFLVWAAVKMGKEMKKTAKTTFGAMMTALAVALMLLSYFPYLTYAIPAVSGLFIMVVLIETNKCWAFMSYIASAVLVFLFADPESRFLYVFFFGYYPIIKALTERLKRPVFEWIIKFAVFNASVLTVYILFANFFSFSIEEFGTFGKYGALILLVLGNIVFIFYDIAVSRIAAVYINMLHPKIKKLLR